MRFTINKLVVASSALLTLIAIAIISYSSWKSSIDAIYQLSKKSYLQATNSLSEQLGTAVKFKKASSIEERVNLAIKSSEGNLSSVDIFLVDKSLLYSSNDQPAPASMQQFNWQDTQILNDNQDSLELVVPLLSGKKKKLVGFMLTKWHFSEVQVLSAALGLQSLLYGTLCILVTVGVLVLTLKKVLINPLDHLSELCQELASGECDLRKRIQFKRNDELGLLANQINKFVDKIERTLNPIHQGSLAVTNVAEDVESHLESLRKKVTSQRNDIKQTVSIGEETISSVESVKSNAGLSSETLNQAVNSAQQGKSRLTKALQDITTLAKKSSSTSESAFELSTQVQKVSEILAIIRTIAEQTNLLALNAAIEAARAGEEGRGFAVVADEVRVLAEKTSTSTDQVESILTELSQVSNELITYTNEGLTASQGCVDSIKQAVEDIKTTLNDVSKASQVNDGIVDSSQSQSQSMAALIHHLTMINQQIDHLAQDTDNISSSSSELHTRSFETSQHLATYNIR
ncbi:methyl-accepting chemotaxis protein [Vibrio sp. S4M6]|uniref:methyl-accepting chemotaxis protein n=1 Tax=Vibrio sinus TaxID=2946865 RepID=UPI00202A7F89|nr:methyl-accepting chemotaxis protein [Vibrio sinus]MCL9782641.1 methyl-accepting chemotaxis protein [Vibrio sinus]